MAHVLERMEIGNWRQFGHIELEFHSDVTIITGANGTGKTTLLAVLAQTLLGGSPIPQPMTPIIGRMSGSREYSAPIRSEPIGGTAESSERFLLGRVDYSDGLEKDILASVPGRQSGRPQYEIFSEVSSPFKPQPEPIRPGAFFPSNRPAFSPESVTAVSNETGNWWHSDRRHEPVRQALYSTVSDSVNDRARMQRGTNYWMKEALLSWAVYGFGNEAVVPEPQLRDYFSGFDKLLHDLLPESFGYRRIVVRGMDIVLETDRGEIPFDALSGGMASMVEMAWALLFADFERTQPIGVIIDEAENHLHAAMQRELLPRLREAFPNAQFVVSTHSPLIASSVKDAYVYALQFGEDGYVDSVRLDLDDWAGSASDVLRDVLGLDATIPVWAEERLRQIAGRLSDATASPELVEEIYDELRDDGLEEFAPQVVANIGRDAPVVE